MAITQKSRWDDYGQEPPAGEAKYTAGEQPIAEYDNWFNKAVVDDIAALNQWLDNLGITKVYIDTEANKPASGATTELFIATDTNKIYRGTGTGWQELTVDWNAILNKPALFEMNVTQITTDYTASSGDIILADASAGAITVTLPDPAVNAVVKVKKIDSSANAVTIDAAGATIDGEASIQITKQHESYTLVSDGSAWYIV